METGRDSIENMVLKTFQIYLALCNEIGKSNQHQMCVVDTM